jgi:hypothetical protein
MEKTSNITSEEHQELVEMDIRKQVGQGMRASRNRGYAYDTTKNLRYLMQKGLTKPGRISFDILRRASYSVHVARICINVLKEKVTKTEWIIKPIDPMAETDSEKVKEVTEFFKHPNKSNETFRTLLDKICEDLLTLDAISVEKTRYPDGKLAELHYVDPATIRPVFDEYGNQDIEIPLRTVDGSKTLPVSYLQVMNNSLYGGPESGDIIAAWPKKDFIYACMHPQGAMDKFGYGMSPLESVLSVVANILNADNYNGTYFEEGSTPPMLLQLMTNMGVQDLEAMKEYLYSELQGSFHRPAIVAGEQKVEVTNLKGNTNRDMEFMNYMGFMARLMAAAYGLSGQDIGLIDDVNRATAEVQKDLSATKGYSSVLHLIKEVFNQEIIWKDFGYSDLEFDWVAPDTTDAKDAMDIYDKGLRAGMFTLNEVRQKLGEQPFEDWADKPMVLGMNGYTQVIAPSTTPVDAVPDEQPGDFKSKEGGKEEMVVGGEQNYNRQAEQEVKKSVFTDDGYKTYFDDRGYSNPFICYQIITGQGYVVKPPIAVNLQSQNLEVELSKQLSGMGLNVPNVTRMTYIDVVNKILATDYVRAEFQKYINMTPEYDSEKWRGKFGGSRKFPEYLVQQFIMGRNLKDPLLQEDMRRDPDSYKQATRDLASLWLVEKQLVLGDRRSDQYIITPDKRAYGIDYQFKGDKKRWEDCKNAIVNALVSMPALQKYFKELTAPSSESTAMKKIRSVLKRMVQKGPLVDSIVQSPEQSFEENPVMFGELIADQALKESVKGLFMQASSAILLERGYTEKIFVHNFPEAKKALEEYVQKNPKGYGGIKTLDDITGKKYFVYVKEYSI